MRRALHAWAMRSARRLTLWLAVGASGAACGSGASSPAPRFPAGDHRDDGHGLLAHASASLVTADDDAPDSPIADDGMPHRRADDPATMFGGAEYGGSPYGDALYGGLGYGAMQTAPDWGAVQTPSMTYETEEGLVGAIEGVVSWTGALPPRVTTACGAQGNPTVHVGADRGVGGVLVYIEKVDVGRALPTYAKAASVGGIVIKRGCALMPSAQIVTPLPAMLTIQGDATAAKLHATAPTGAARAIELEEGGVAQLDTPSGVMRIDSDDGKLAPAWVIGVDTPYYAITDDAGRFRIDELAAGTYDVAVWQAPIATVGAGNTIAYGAPVVVHRKVSVDAGSQAARMNVALH